MIIKYMKNFTWGIFINLRTLFSDSFFSFIRYLNAYNRGMIYLEEQCYSSFMDLFE